MSCGGNGEWEFEWNARKRSLHIFCYYLGTSDSQRDFEWPGKGLFGCRMRKFVVRVSDECLIEIPSFLVVAVSSLLLNADFYLELKTEIDL